MSDSERHTITFTKEDRAEAARRETEMWTQDAYDLLVRAWSTHIGPLGQPIGAEI